MSGTPTTGVEAEIDRLYQLRLDEFTSARNALAARLKAAGEAEAAARVKALAKPSVSAWAVNQLYWTARREFDALLAAGDDLRAAQQASLAGKPRVDLQQAVRTRGEAVSAALKRISSLHGGDPPGPAVKQRIATTLEALASYGTSSGAPQAGRLTADIDPPGFAALAGLGPLASPRPASPLKEVPRALARGAPPAVSTTAPARDAAIDRRLAQAGAALAGAEREAASRREEAQRLAAGVAEAAARAETADAELTRARRQLAEATDRQKLAAAALASARTRERAAAAALAQAERALEKAKAGVRSLGGD